MNELDFILLLVILIGAIIGIRRGFIRELISILGIYVAVVVAGYAYDPMGRTLSDAFNLGSDLTFNFSYLVVLIAITVVMELVSRKTFEETRLPRLGKLDNLLGGIVGVGYGALWASLLFIPFQFSRSWMVAIRGSTLLPSLNDFFWLIVLDNVGFLFAGGIPRLYYNGVPRSAAQLLIDLLPLYL